MSTDKSEALRCEDRRGIDLPAAIYLSDGRRFPASVSDLSYAGCRIACEADLAADDRITLVVFARGSEQQAEIKWSGQGEAGAVFL